MATLAELKAQHRRGTGDASTPLARAPTWEMLTLSLPADTSLGVPDGRWERRDGRIAATYNRAELRAAVALALEQRRHDLEARLEHGLEVLAAATGCDDAEAERLLAYWDALNAEYDRVMEPMRAVGLDGVDMQEVTR